MTLVDFSNFRLSLEVTQIAVLIHNFVQTGNNLECLSSFTIKLYILSS